MLFGVIRRNIEKMNKEILQIKLGLNPYHEKYMSKLKALPKEIKEAFKAQWELTKDYALDKRTNIKWYKAIDTKQYTYKEVMEKYGNSLPTKEEYEEAEKHGIRFVLEDFEDKWYWSSSVSSNNRVNSWNFFGTNGNVFNVSRNNNYWARCVSRPSVTQKDCR